MKSLNLSQNSRLTDDSLASIAHLSALESLNLMHSRITNDGIPHLKSEFDTRVYFLLSPLLFAKVRPSLCCAKRCRHGVIIAGVDHKLGTKWRVCVLLSGLRVWMLLPLQVPMLVAFKSWPSLASEKT